MSLDKKVQNIFLTKKSKVLIDDKVNILLSPEFYWVREFEIPIKNKKEALKYLPELFVEILPDEEYNYYAIKKSENNFLGFAYKNEVILEAIKRANIKKQNINKIYFAQNELYEYKEFRYLEECFLYTSDDILVKNPFIECEEYCEIELYLQKLKLSKYKIDINLNFSYIKPKFIYILTIFLSVFIVLNMFRYFLYNDSYKKIQSKIEKVQKDYNMPKTSFETISILNKMKSEYKINENFREALEYILKYKKIDKDMVFKEINYSNDIFKLKVININATQFSDYFLEKFKILSQNKNNTDIYVELKYVKN
ncbi:hypothetical protein CRV08_08680 [Halarcobacter ebronensis]|uniref:Uncharacterized protein n=1 Tax=Halarcobacter ebronensis TaxID=1462615 RepID=A0A4Q0YD07_9BACT|nr:hypothetical protein [Halarcobacter ebronensis]RXJ68316.1 hypothetical protein CRV08_08680 [Halarcobacter ebronensis]